MRRGFLSLLGNVVRAHGFLGADPGHVSKSALRLLLLSKSHDVSCVAAFYRGVKPSFPVQATFLDHTPLDDPWDLTNLGLEARQPPNVPTCRQAFGEPTGSEQRTYR